jgi:hypothetical protein
MVERHTLDQRPAYDFEIRTMAGGFKVSVVGGYARAIPRVEREWENLIALGGGVHIVAPPVTKA